MSRSVTQNIFFHDRMIIWALLYQQETDVSGVYFEVCMSIFKYEHSKDVYRRRRQSNPEEFLPTDFYQSQKDYLMSLVQSRVLTVFFHNVLSFKMSSHRVNSLGFGLSIKLTQKVAIVISLDDVFRYNMICHCFVPWAMNSRRFLLKSYL